MREIVRRALHASHELTAELQRRGMFHPGERAELVAERNGEPSPPLGSTQFVTLLAQGDAQLAAAVLRGLLTHEELGWMDRLLKFKKPNGKRDELARVVERAIEGRQGNVRR